MKRILFSLFFLLVTTTLLFPDVSFKTIYTTKVGPGILHKKVVAPSMPWELDVVEIDLTNPYLVMETVHAGDNIKGRERTSSMARRIDRENYRVVGAVNGDFFDGDGLTINAQISDGQMVKDENIDPNNITYWSTIEFDTNNRPAISRNLFVSSMLTSSGDIAISTVNRIRNENQLVLYNQYMGDGTGTNQWGTECLVRPLSGWIVNDTVYCEVESKEVNVGNMSIPDGKAVLSGHGSSAEFLNSNLEPGDTVNVFIGLQGAPARLTTLMGGFPRIVKNGQNYAYQGYAEEGGSSTFHTARHPRTAAGFSADSTKLYFVTVDGRQDHSIGMSLMELADFMISIGVTQAVNLDGGGSTTMFVRNEIKNSPSDGNERAVANALLAISTAPKGELAHIQIEPDQVETRLNGTISFNTTGWDEYFGPVSLSNNSIMYEVDSLFGTISPSGEFKATTNGASGYVFVRKGDLVDSAEVYVKAIKSISLSPRFCVTDTVQPVVFKMTVVDEDDKSMSLGNTNFEWITSNPEVGSINAVGEFRGLKEGTTKIHVKFGEMKDSAEVRVEVGEGRKQLDDMDSGVNWELKGLNLDTLNTRFFEADTPKTFGDKSFQIDYSFVKSSTEYAWLYLNTDIEVFGVPDHILLDFKGDGNAHKVYIIASDNDGELFRASVRPFMRNTVFETIEYATTSFQPVTVGTFHYPIRIKTIEMRIGTNVATGDTARGNIYFDNLRATYPLATALHENVRTSAPRTYMLYQNYPNPFNPETTIGYMVGASVRAYDHKPALPVNLSIYNCLGQKVTTLVSGTQSAGSYAVQWDARQYASGVYYYQLTIDGRKLETRKMLLLK